MNLSTQMLAALQKSSINPRWLLWISAKNRTTGMIEQSGIWTGIGPLTVTVDGEARTYHGAGALLGIGSLSYAVGTDIGSQTVNVSILDPQIIQMIRIYDSVLAPCQIHLGLMDDAESLIGLAKGFDGWVDGIEVSEGPEESSCSLKLVSSIRAGTKPLYLKQSDAAQKERDASDDGRKYSSISDAVKVAWGQETDKPFTAKGSRKQR